MMPRILLAVWLFWTALAQAQLVTVPIPGAPGLSVTVATGTAAQPLSMISGSPNAVNVTMADDDYRAIPLQFTFPFFGQNFTQSWMHSNGVVSFQSPQVTGNFCCVGENLTTTTNPALNYAIMPLWTDLIANTVGSHWYLSRPNDMTYAWYNVSQYGTQNTSSFEVRIDRQGLVDVRLQGALITASPVTLGMTGNLSQGQYFQHYHGVGFTTQSLQWSALAGTTAAVDPCVANPLSSPTCPNYAAAYLTQQCTISALYDPTCPGYQQAYFTYQCSINPLYSELCPGYAQAYFTQQCTANPLYDAKCPGYAQAYYNQQCSLNPLYDSGCTGYAQAYFDQQCSLNGLYDRNCPNYATAYATKMLLNNQTVTNTTTAVTTTAATTTTEPVTASSVTQVSTTGNSTVDKAITPTTTTAITASAPAAAVQLTQPAASADPASPSPVASTGTGNQSTAPQPQQTQTQAQPTTRAQQLQQARQEAARKEAAARGGENMKEAREAKSMEQQVAAQNQIIGAMGYNPGFDVYNSLVLRDRGFYSSVQIYPNSRTVDNTRLLRGLTGASERRFDQMVDQQYQQGVQP